MHWQAHTMFTCGNIRDGRFIGFSNFLRFVSLLFSLIWNFNKLINRFIGILNCHVHTCDKMVDLVNKKQLFGSTLAWKQQTMELYWGQVNKRNISTHGALALKKLPSQSTVIPPLQVNRFSDTIKTLCI